MLDTCLVASSSGSRGHHPLALVLGPSEGTDDKAHCSASEQSTEPKGTPGRICVEDLDLECPLENTVMFADSCPKWLTVFLSLGFQCTSVFCRVSPGRHQKWFHHVNGGPWWTAGAASKWHFTDYDITRAFTSGGLDFIKWQVWHFPAIHFIATVHGNFKRHDL